MRGRFLGASALLPPALRLALPFQTPSLLPFPSLPFLPVRFLSLPRRSLASGDTPSGAPGTERESSRVGATSTRKSFLERSDLESKQGGRRKSLCEFFRHSGPWAITTSPDEAGCSRPRADDARVYGRLYHG